MTRVLIVDDIETNRYLLESVFKGCGYQVISAVHGAEALRMANEDPPDLIITDILMPVMDGFELCRRWKADPGLTAIPFIFYTATYTDRKDEEFALRLGADRFVIKPQKPEVLVRLVEEVLEEFVNRRGETSGSLLGDEMESLRQYNQVLFRKLEDKMRQLQATNRSLRETEGQFRRLFEDSVVAKSITLPTGGVTVNRAFCAMLGYSESEMRGITWQSVTHPDDIAMTAREIDALLVGEKQAARFEKRYLHKDGSIIWGEVSSSIHRGEEGKPIYFMTTVIDVTERRRAEQQRSELEAQLRQSQKMEAIGSLAGGVAHDFNNLLSVILSYAGFALEEMRPDDPLRDYLLEIKNASEHACMLTRQLLAFSRKQILEPKILDLNAVLVNLEKMLRRLIGEDVRFELALSQEIGRIKADPGQIEQVLMNLVVNARDAMQNGGRLTIETACAGARAESAQTSLPENQGPRVLLAISDTGCGMDAAIQQRIFEPFFSTKERGKGTGLGLSTVYGIVTQSGGTIELTSEPGQGTTFRIFFPAWTGPHESEALSSTIVRPDLGTETILIVEDEEGVRKATSRILRTAGYQVLAAADPDEALRVCENSPGRIHLLLSDVILPHMSGPALGALLRRLRPDLRVMFMSGYTQQAALHDGLMNHEACFLGKPFTREELLGKVREALDRIPQTGPSEDLRLD